MDQHIARLSCLNKLLLMLKELKELKQRKKCKRSCSVRQINHTRNIHGYYKVTFLKMMEVDPGQFFIHTRTTKEHFKMLLELVRPAMEKTDKIRINTEFRLALTLLYLSQGNSIQSLAWRWKIGKETARLIILESCEAIWTVIGPLYVTEPNTADFEEIEKDFWNLWNMPNCLGAIDGKHVAIQCPPGTGSQFFNYTKYFSIVLMAACDARYVFTHVDVGAYGSQSDGGIFNISELGKKICSNSLELLPPKRLPNSNIVLPHFFVADAAFSLTKNLMKPYPGSGLTHTKEIYNKRLSRARRVIENAFGILVSRWRILLTTLNMLPKNAEKVVLACVALHNFLRLNKDSAQVYMPKNFVDWEDKDHTIHEGLWRSEISRSLMSIAPSHSTHVIGGRTAIKMRDELCAFLNNEGRLNWMN